MWFGIERCASPSLVWRMPCINSQCPGRNIPPFGLKLLSEASEDAQQREVEPASATRGVITSFQDKRYIVEPGGAYVCLRKVSSKRHSMQPCDCTDSRVAEVAQRFHPECVHAGVLSLDIYPRNIQPVDTRYLEILPDSRCYPLIPERARGRPIEKMMRNGDVQHRRGRLDRRNAVAGRLGDVPDNAPVR